MHWYHDNGEQNNPGYIIIICISSVSMLSIKFLGLIVRNEPRCEKTGLRSF